VETVRIGTRGSALARTQTGHVADALRALGDFEIEIIHIRTDGDRLTGPLATLGGTGVFVTALRDAVLEGRCDLAVHSLKDLPTGDAPGLTIAAIPPRADARDALCTRDGRPLVGLPSGARVGTGSPRRVAQLLAVRPDLEVVDLRGNVDTRLRRVTEGDLDAVVLAAAGLQRIGRLDATTVPLEPTLMVPAPGQGALAVECRADLDPGSALALALRALDDLPTRLAVTAERAVLATLEAGCSAPVGAYAQVDGRRLALSATVVAADGSARIHRTATRSLPVQGDDAAPTTGVALSRDAAITTARTLGADLAAELLAAGAARLMATRTERS
jgi:hydroxymethylbilane synthase